MGYYERCQHDQSFRAEPRLFPLGYALRPMSYIRFSYRSGAMVARTSSIAHFLSSSPGGLLVLCLLSLLCDIGVILRWRLKRLLLLPRRKTGISLRQICRGIRVYRRSSHQIDRIRLRHLRQNRRRMDLLILLLS